MPLRRKTGQHPPRIRTYRDFGPCQNTMVRCSEDRYGSFATGSRRRPITPFPVSPDCYRFLRCNQKSLCARNGSAEVPRDCGLSAKLYCCADQISILRSHNTIRQMNSVLKANPSREIETPGLANAGPNAAGFSMQEDRQSAVCSIKYREDLMSLSQCLFAIAAGHFHQNSEAFPEIYLGNKSLSILAVPKPRFDAYAAGNQEVNYLGCVRFGQVNGGIVG